MELQQVRDVVGDLPNMSLERAQRLQALIGDSRDLDVLELGFHHGVGTSYLAAMVEPGGSVTAIDLEDVLTRSPTAAELLDELGLTSTVTLMHETTSYTWALMRMLEDGKGPRFDLVYLDGSHNWETDGLAFYLADKLLRTGGWLVLDDLTWSYATSSIKGEPWVLKMSYDEQHEPHVRKIWDLLVVPHPSYDSLSEEGPLAIARKTASESTALVKVVNVRPTLAQWLFLIRRAVTSRLPSRMQSRKDVAPDD